MSRTRLIRPEFFSDERMSSAKVPTRLFYIGLWTLCDDAGYFELAPRQIAAELFRYETPRRREVMVDRAIDELVGLGRIRLLDCGNHAIVPTLPDHRTKSGEALFTIQKRHERRCSVGLRRTTSDLVPVSGTGLVSGTDSDSGSAGLKPKNLNDYAKDAGGFAARLASKKVPA